MNNLGTLGFILTLLILLHVLVKLMWCCEGDRCCRKSKRWIAKNLYYGMILRTIMESYVIGILCTLINTRVIDFSTSGYNWTFANAIITCSLFPIYVLFPIFAVGYMLCNWSSLNSKETKQRFGELYEGYNTSSRHMIVYWGLDYMRKTMLCLSVIFIKDFFAQMMIFYFSSNLLIVGAGFLNARKTL